MEKTPHISIKAEPIFDFFGIHVTNSYLASLVVILTFFLVAFYYSSQISKTERPRLFYLFHFMFRSFYNFFKTVAGDKITFLFPLLGSLFFYILLSNWFGLLPGVGSILVKVVEDHEVVFVPLLRGTTADLNTTVALAIVAVFSIQYYSIKYLGFKGYITKFINISNPISFFVGILEIVSEFSKIISFSFRLFGNIFAGEVILIIITFLIPFFVSFPFLVLEVFVGFIQGFVFAMLTAVFISLATTRAHH